MIKYRRHMLWEGTVGSHMWAMNHANSDLDLFKVYIVDTDAILVGFNFKKGKEIKIEKDDNHPEAQDIVEYEFGHVIQQLKKGNINFLWGVTTPMVWNATMLGNNVHSDLVYIIKNNLSKNYFHAIKGMAVQNLKKYFGVEYKDGGLYDTGKYKIPVLGKKWHKKCKLLDRTLNFGIKLMNNKIDFNYYNTKGFKRINSNPSLTQVFNSFHALVKAYESSTLPENPNFDRFDKFLITVRRRVLSDYG